MSPVTVLAVVLDSALGEEIRADVTSVLGDRVAIDVVDDASAAIETIRRVEVAGGVVPVAFVQMHRPDRWGVETVRTIQRDELGARTRSVVVTSTVSLRGVDEALQVGAIQGMITRPWTSNAFEQILLANLATYLVEHAPDRFVEFEDLLDEDDRRRAQARARRARPPAEMQERREHPLLDPELDDAALESALVDLLDEALGHPPRLRVGPGTVLIEADEDVGGFYLVLDGVVRLTSRTESGDLVLHERSTGAIVGLLSLASRRRAMLQCRAVTDVRAIPVTIDQLSRALHAEPELSEVLTRVLISSLARRLRRSDQLQVELDRSLAELSAARAQLVAAERFATLGEMSAGMAHELNNPTAALLRSVDHLLDDVEALIGDSAASAALRRRLAAETPSTAELRRRRRTVREHVGDRQLADQLIDIGVETVSEADEVLARPASERDRLRSAAQLGDTVRNIANAAERIQSLVHSLRAYARGGGAAPAFVSGVSVTDGIEDALRLLGHRLGAVQVVRRYDDLPAITARPGALQQIWTNVIANALDAIGDDGVLTITAREDGADVVVEIGDDGPGVPPDIGDQIFEPRFTTKDGQVTYGLGLGLSISRQLVTEHGGTIEFESAPGDTVFRVTLPVSGADRGG